MMTNQKATGKAASLPVGLAYGAMVSVGITLAAAAILAKLVDVEKLSWNHIGYGIMILLMLSSFLGSITAYIRIKRQRLVVCLMSGAIYFALLLSITALFFGGQYDAVGVTAALILAGSGTAGLLGIREKRGGKPLKRKIGYR